MVAYFENATYLMKNDRKEQENWRRDPDCEPDFGSLEHFAAFGCFSKMSAVD